MNCNLLIIFIALLFVACGSKPKEASVFEKKPVVLRPPIEAGPDNPPVPTPTPYPDPVTEKITVASRGFNPGERDGIELPYKKMHAKLISAGQSKSWDEFVKCARSRRKKCFNNKQVGISIDINHDVLDFPNGLDTKILDIKFMADFYLHPKSKKTEIFCMLANKESICEGRRRGNMSYPQWLRWFQNIVGVRNNKFWKKAKIYESDQFWKIINGPRHPEYKVPFAKNVKISLKRMMRLTNKQLHGLIFDNSRRLIQFIIADDVFVFNPRIEVTYVHDPYAGERYNDNY